MITTFADIILDHLWWIILAITLIIRIDVCVQVWIIYNQAVLQVIISFLVFVVSSILFVIYMSLRLGMLLRDGGIKLALVIVVQRITRIYRWLL